MSKLRWDRRTKIGNRVVKVPRFTTAVSPQSSKTCYNQALVSPLKVFRSRFSGLRNKLVSYKVFLYDRHDQIINPNFMFLQLNVCCGRSSAQLVCSWVTH